MSTRFRITPSQWERIHHYASLPRTGVSLQQLVQFGQDPSIGTLLRGSQFLSKELPIRLAHRVQELDELPHNLSNTPSVQRVKSWYVQSFEELANFPHLHLSADVQAALMSTQTESLLSTSKHSLRNGHERSAGSPRERGQVEQRDNATRQIAWPPEVHDYVKRFTKVLQNVKHRHDPTVTTIARGVLEWKRSQNASQICPDIQAWLDCFYLSRIGIRFLIGQHIALSTQPAHSDYVGIIGTKVNIYDIVQEAIENARFVCQEHYSMFQGPPVELVCPQSLTVAYVPGHLSHICFELLKNSLRAVVERFGVDGEDYFPPIKVIVVEGKEDITIKISDEGGGIPRSAIPFIWTYMYTTMKQQHLDKNFQASDFKAPLAGLGYGLPLSRLYARYFGGDLRLISMEGFGTDVYIHLNKLSSSMEALP
ncbi:mitochondrial branched-chain alpha-ketoacid dehydrogenase kinase-domain-containing protein [Coprinopsis sp. MPI-PUGE-AT-0042]|nr:mitochondrial branched-chain alpha-ketoacid dehydrogenase kinase-domain-containing protein [Coprinopsis sp. MPI-PUGE-AT-0042]